MSPYQFYSSALVVALEHKKVFHDAEAPEPYTGAPGGSGSALPCSRSLALTPNYFELLRPLPEQELHFADVPL
jgi:hypothetical protein